MPWVADRSHPNGRDALTKARLPCAALRLGCRRGGAVVRSVTQWIENSTSDVAAAGFIGHSQSHTGRSGLSDTARVATMPPPRRLMLGRDGPVGRRVLVGAGRRRWDAAASRAGAAPSHRRRGTRAPRHRAPMPRRSSAPDARALDTTTPLVHSCLSAPGRHPSAERAEARLRLSVGQPEPLSGTRRRTTGTSEGGPRIPDASRTPLARPPPAPGP